MRRILSFAMSIAMLAAVAVAGTASAVEPPNSDYFGKGEALIYDAWNVGDCGEPGLDAGSVAGKVKINVKDGSVKVSVKLEDGSAAGRNWNVRLHQVHSWNPPYCDIKTTDVLGSFLADADGKGGFKATPPYSCGANVFWVELYASPASYASLPVKLTESSGGCAL